MAAPHVANSTPHRRWIANLGGNTIGVNVLGTLWYSCVWMSLIFVYLFFQSWTRGHHRTLWKISIANRIIDELSNSLWPGLECIGECILLAFLTFYSLSTKLSLDIISVTSWLPSTLFASSAGHCKLSSAPICTCLRMQKLRRLVCLLVPYQAKSMSFVSRCFTSLFHNHGFTRTRNGLLQNKSLFGTTLTTILARNNHTAKTHSGMKKRFRIRANGSIKRSQAGRQHNTGYKARSRKNRLSHSAGIKDRTVERKLKLCMGSTA